MRRTSFLRAARGAAVCLLAFGSTAIGACTEEFEPVKAPSKQISLGDDLYSVMCDRVAASAEPWDLELRHSHEVCHPDADGKYADDYREGEKPMPPTVAVMARYRPDLVEAFNKMFPKYDPATCKVVAAPAGDSGGVGGGSPEVEPDCPSMHADLQALLREVIPLYDDDTIPESTRTLAALMEAIAFDGNGKDDATLSDAARKAKIAKAKEVQAALARLGGRRGYRSMPIGVGVAKPILAYKDFTKVIDTAITKLGPGGDAETELRKVLEVTQAELDSTVVPPPRAPITGYLDRFTGVTAARPKLTSEILKNLLVDAPPAAGKYGPDWTKPYARDGAGGFAPDLWTLVRDPRGYASFETVPAEAQDKDSDGLTDVDGFGRFVAKTGKPLDLPTPFKLPLYVAAPVDKAPRDTEGRVHVGSATGPLLYKYQNAARTMMHSVLVDLKTIADPKNNALLDMAHAALWQFGPRVDDVKKYTLSDGTTADVKYKKFDVDKSPMGDLVYATARFLQYDKTPEYLELTRQLLRDHPNETARIVGAILKVREIADRPEFAGVNLDPKSSLWDDVIAVAVKIASDPALLKEVLESLGEDDTLIMTKAMSTFFANKDLLDYDPAGDGCWASGAHPDTTCPALNNPSYNATLKASHATPASPVDLTKGDEEGNRSVFQRFVSLIHDSYGVRACNKPGATINTRIDLGLFSIPVKLPFSGTYEECAALEIPDLAMFYLECVVGGVDEKTKKARCTLPVKDALVGALNSIPGASGLLDSLLEGSSGIKGLTQTPTVEALNRMVFWRNPNKFVYEFTAPFPTAVCPITNPTTGHRTCASDADLLIKRQESTIFVGEYLDVLKGFRPMLTPFVKKRGADFKSNLPLFIELLDVFNSHWSDGKNPRRCKAGVPRTDPQFCTGTNARAYEKLVSEVLKSDLMPALNAFTKVTKSLRVNGKSGTDVMVSLVNDLINPANAAGMGLTDRQGNTKTTTNDGREVKQTTPYYLFANALNAMDSMWVGAKGEADHAVWKASRSKLVDQFLAVDVPADAPQNAAFKNAAVAAALPILIDVLDDRLDEHRAKGDLAEWLGGKAGVKGQMLKDFEDSIGGPLMAASMDLQEKLYADPKTRDTLGNLLAYLADKASANDALPVVVTATEDLLQVVGDEVNMVPVYHALAVGSAPDGATKRTLDLIERIRGIEAGETWVAEHGGRRVIEAVLGLAVTPMGPGKASPIEVLIDCVTDVNRANPMSNDAFAAEDYGAVAKSIHGFLKDPTRGLEQFYTIVRYRETAD
jgi:hypothetical protein